MIEMMSKYVKKIENENIIFNDELYEMINDKSTNSIKKIMIGTELYRSRIIRDGDPLDFSINYKGYDKKGSFVNPNIEMIQPMRANRAGQQRLYCADVNYLALIEVRPKINDNISLATIKVNDILTILDLTLYHIPDDMSNEKKKLFDALSLLFSKPINEEEKNEYIYTQVIADYVASLGYDGIAYSSSLCPALNKENYSCANFVIFNFEKCEPIKSNVLMLDTIARTDNTYDYRNFKQIDNDEERLDLISYKDKYNIDKIYKSSKNNDEKNGWNKNIFISVKNIVYNPPIKIFVKKQNKVNLINVNVGKNLLIPFCGTKLQDRKFTLSTKINEQINDLTYLLESIHAKELWFGDRENPKVGSVSLDISNIKENEKLIEFYTARLNFASKVKDTLLMLGITDDLDLKLLNKEDSKKLQLLVEGLNNGHLILTSNNLPKYDRFVFNNKVVYIQFEKVSEGKYKVYDYFSTVNPTEGFFGEIKLTAPHFSSMTYEDFIKAANMKFNKMINCYESIYKSNKNVLFAAVFDVYKLIKAFDKTKNSEYLHIANDINKWIYSKENLSFHREYLDINTILINSKMRNITETEKYKLISITKSSNVSNSVKIDAYGLLSDIENVKKTYLKLNDIEKINIKDNPIFYENVDIFN